jgi:hypothetical protein
VQKKSKKPFKMSPQHNQNLKISGRKKKVSHMRIPNRNINAAPDSRSENYYLLAKRCFNSFERFFFL